MLPLLGAVMPIVSKVLDKVIPDPKAAAEAKNTLLAMQQSGELKAAEVQLSAILAEAKSGDPWTSRARPTFMYVIYAYIVAAIPFGVVFAFDAATANDVVAGVAGWLRAIPDAMWTTFTVGYLGYTGARSYDKANVRKLMEKVNG